ncbi:MAG TPA: metallophosphoesterase, partial [Thermomicrobiales bacterium]|nr:metallophosphoesterase [Thermomicrobiales bacterium]
MSSPPRFRTAVRTQRLPAWLRLFLIGCMLLVSQPAGAAPGQVVDLDDLLAQNQPCVTTNVSSSTIQTCITAPSSGATLNGDVTISASVTATSGGLPSIDTVRWYLTPASQSGSTLIATEYQTPWTLQLPTNRWVDGQYRLGVNVVFKSGSSTSTAQIPVTLNNGVSTAPGSNGSWSPVNVGGSSAHVVAVGDGASDRNAAAAVGALATNLNPDMFLYLGDVYDYGTYTEMYNYYGPTLGALDSRTNPVPGNHEGKDNFRGYFDYWNSDTHYYSATAGGWKIIALNNNPQFPGQTSVGSAQYNWLRDQLQNNSATCTMVIMHYPRFGLINTGGNAFMQPMWELMVNNGVDVVLAGHEHNYQRWSTLDANGQVSSVGTTQYIVGSGGHSQDGANVSDSRTQFFRSGLGVLSMQLNPNGGTAQYITTAGAVVDSSTLNCNNGGGGTSTPTPTSTTPPGGSTTTLNPVADARVAAAAPTTNYGTQPTLLADTSPQEMSYLRFNVQGVNGTVTNAKLR